jgi:sodium/potassium-transporting ATPase subunit alpha
VLCYLVLCVLLVDNLKKVTLYLLPAGSWSEMLPVIANVFLGVPLPLSPFLMIVICILTDLGPSLALVNEKPEDQISQNEEQPTTKDDMGRHRHDRTADHA